MARAQRHLLDHLFKSVKARQEAVNPRTDLDRAEFIARGRMPVQRRVAEDPARRVSVRCPRRAGKSWLALSIAIERCLRKPGSVWVILGLARPSVQQIFWGLIKQISQTLELHLQFKEVELSATFTNGSVILFRGAETRSEVEKLRGGQYDGVIIDECKSFNPVIFTELVQEVIEPALNDRLGTLILVGTPGEILAGPFYEATCTPPICYGSADVPAADRRYSNRPYGPAGDAYVPIESEYFWSFHSWTLEDNVEMPHLWAEALKTKRKYGWKDNHPTWLREYLGEWVASKDHIVYRYVPHIHDYEGELPPGHNWRFVLGLDIGFKDADAICVWAYAETSFDVYLVYGVKRAKLNITDLAAWVREVRSKYDVENMCADHTAKVLDELATIHGLHFELAEKREKNDFIEIMNNEYDLKRIRIHVDAKQLRDELLQNRWLEKTLGTGKKTEDPKTPNDLCDAHLYGWRWCDHRRAQPPERKPEKHSSDWWRARVAEEMQDAIQQHLAAKARQSEDFGRMDQDWFEHDR